MASHPLASDKSIVDTNSPLFNTGIIAPGASQVVDTVDLSKGENQYHCLIHLFMAGTLYIEIG
jgi:hypothetical protein